eukprot:1155518-Prymnesium_polylepis.1
MQDGISSSSSSSSSGHVARPRGPRVCRKANKKLFVCSESSGLWAAWARDGARPRQVRRRALHR